MNRVEANGQQIDFINIGGGFPVAYGFEGPICETGDYFALARQLPPLSNDSILAAGQRN